MAPVLPPPSRPVYIPGRLRIAPPRPVETTQYISVKVLLQLFAGTVCIFLLAVLFWRTGRFFRYFTRNRVLREGNTVTTRYARTWYGWVTLQRHEANKNIFRRCLARIRDLTAWRSSKTDYHWVWWDPDEKGLKTYLGKRQRLRPVPTWARSYSFATADAIWNPEHFRPSISQPASRDTMRAASHPKMTGALSASRARRLMTISSRVMSGTSITIPENIHCGLKGAAVANPQQQCSWVYNESSSESIAYLTFSTRGKFKSWNDFLTSNCVLFDSMDFDRQLLCSVSLPCLLLPRMPSIKPRMDLATRRKPYSASLDSSITSFLPALQHARMYQIWSAQMGLQTLKAKRYSTHTLPKAPPGSPRSALLGSLSSTNTALGLTNLHRRRVKANHSSISSLIYCFNARKSHRITKDEESHSRVKSSLPERQQAKALVYNPRSSLIAPITISYNHAIGCAHSASVPEIKEPTKSQARHSQKKPDNDEPSKVKKLPQYIVPINNMSNWEIRLLYSLDRKLEWLATQLSPGRRPFHFTLLPNHWLNRETWIVYDPASRVSIDARRRLGDPRFNLPYPAPTLGPKPKHRKIPHRTAHTPKINSWRLAMNKYRRVSGLNDFVKGIKLYDSSAEDPPDGRVDPASWILRKPPQGFGFSNKQQDMYYEGGAGWQEKLSDWQKIRRGYRIRKAIFEGQVNRARAKEIAFGISRYYKMAVSKASKGSNKAGVGEDAQEYIRTTNS